MEKTFHNSNSIGDQHSFELIDLLVASLPFLLARDSLHPLDQDAPVPGAIEHYDLAGVGKLLPKALKVVLTLLVRQRRRNRIDLPSGSQSQNPQLATSQRPAASPSQENDPSQNSEQYRLATSENVGLTPGPSSAAPGSAQVAARSTTEPLRLVYIQRFSLLRFPISARRPWPLPFDSFGRGYATETGNCRDVTASSLSS